MKDENLEEVFKLAQEIGKAIGTYCTDEQVKLFEKILEDYKIKNEKVFKQQKIIDKMAEDIVLLREVGWLTNINNKQDAIEYYTKLVEEKK